MRRHAALAALVVCACAALPPGARAATVGAQEDCAAPGECLYNVSYVAAPGERNVVTLHPRDDGQVVIRDAGAPLAAGENCTATAPGEVRCRNAGRNGHGFVRLALGDLDDSLTASDYRVWVLGGDGADAIAASPQSLDIVDGGPGDDSLDGGGGEEDVAFYGERAGAVDVDLAAGRGGEAGERDALAGFEWVTGGRGDDRLAGTARGDFLAGGFGDDRVLGRDGRDELLGDSGADRLDGGAGNDRIGGGNGDDVVLGGRGGDRLYGGRGDDRVAGGPQRNLSFGGPGDDRLELVNGRREQASCGSGRDRALLDPADRARACEHVVRRQPRN